MMTENLSRICGVFLLYLLRTSLAVSSLNPDVYQLLPNGTYANGGEDLNMVMDGPQPFSHYPWPIVYRDPVVNESYKSSDTFDAKGMQPVYYLTNLLLEGIQSEDLPAGFFDGNTTLSHTLELVYNKREELLVHYSGLIAAASIGLLLALIFLIGGFIFCICRCAGKCGARSSPYEKPYDPCKRISLGIVLATLVIVIIFGIVGAFVTNEYMEENVNELPVSLNNGLQDVKLYQNNTKIEINNLLVNNFEQLEVTLDVILDRCGDIVQMHLAEVSKALAVENLTNIVSGLGAVREDLNGIAENTRKLQVLASDLEDTLNKSRPNLQRLVALCTLEDDTCRQLHEKLDLLRVKPDFRLLPDVRQVATEISRLISEDIETEVRKGKESLDGISAHIQNEVNKTIPQIKRSVRDVGADLEKNSKKICNNIDNEVELQPAVYYVDELKFYIDNYAIYRYYVSVAMCCVILLITLLFVFGLFCGFCGRKPNYVYGDDSCTKGTGSRLVMIAVYLILLFYFVLMVITTALFLVGGVSTRVVCDPIIHNSNSSNLLTLVNLAVKEYHLYPKSHRKDFNFVETLRRCNNNESIYNVLGLESEVNIDAVTNYRQRFHVKDKIKELAQKISLSPSITILTPQAKQQLQRLADSRISEINFTLYDQVLSRDIVELDFSQLIGNLTRVREILESSQSDISKRLWNEILVLEGLQNKVIIPIQGVMGKLRINLQNLQQDIRFNKTSFKEGVQGLISQAEKAQDFIQNKGRGEVISLANRLADNFTNYLDEYANRVNFQVKEEIGKCWPVSQAVNASIVAVCSSILDPLNGFWASIGWCLIMFIPCIFLAVHLSSLYQKTDLHALPSTESDCFSDILPDRDTIPLANHNDKKRKRKPQLTYDNQNGYVHDASPGYANSRPETPPHRVGSYYPANTCDYSSGTEGYELDDPHTFRNIPVKSSSPSSRTPLQEWDFQNEAPPLYNSATNLTVPDFERPPPYYYPGPSPDVSKF